MTTHQHGDHDQQHTKPSPGAALQRSTSEAGPFAVDPRQLPPQRRSPASAVVWLAGGAVAAGAAIATAHGLYEVAAASGVPPGLAWIYPLITDGLALVAYAATSRLHARAARYAWTVVVLAAGLSGLAQAAYLATGSMAGAAGLGGPGPLLRFGVGAWPAVAAAIVAHLLYLLGAPDTQPGREHTGGPLPVDASVSTPRIAAEWALPPGHGVHAVHAPRAVSTVGVHEHAVSTPASTGHPGTVHARIHSTTYRPVERAPGEPADGPATPRERATRAATSHHGTRGAWPSVRALAEIADVSTGLAAKVLRQLRTDTTSTETTNENPS